MDVEVTGKGDLCWSYGTVDDLICKILEVFKCNQHTFQLNHLLHSYASMIVIIFFMCIAIRPPKSNLFTLKKRQHRTWKHQKECVILHREADKTARLTYEAP